LIVYFVKLARRSYVQRAEAIIGNQNQVEMRTSTPPETTGGIGMGASASVTIKEKVTNQNQETHNNNQNEDDEFSSLIGPIRQGLLDNNETKVIPREEVFQSESLFEEIQEFSPNPFYELSLHSVDKYWVRGAYQNHADEEEYDEDAYVYEDEDDINPDPLRRERSRSRSHARAVNQKSRSRSRTRGVNDRLNAQFSRPVSMSVSSDVESRQSRIVNFDKPSENKKVDGRSRSTTRNSKTDSTNQQQKH